MSSLWSHFGFGAIHRSSLDKLLTRHEEYLASQARSGPSSAAATQSNEVAHEAQISSPPIGVIARPSSPTSSDSSDDLYEDVPMTQTMDTFPQITKRVSSASRVYLEEILDEDDVIREATKEGEPRLIRYLSEPSHLSRMLGYVIGKPGGQMLVPDRNDETLTRKEFLEPEDNEFRFSWICSQLLSEATDELVDALLQSSHHDQTLTPFWTSILDADPCLTKDGAAGSTFAEDDRAQRFEEDEEDEDDREEERGRAVESPANSATSRPSKSVPRAVRKRFKTNPAVARYIPSWARVNTALFAKRPKEMLKFLQARPWLLDNLLRHAENSTISEMILKLVHAEGYSGKPPITAWLSRQQAIQKLSAFLSPWHSVSTHQAIGDLLKSIVMMSASNPDQGQLGPTHLIDDMVDPDFVKRLCSYALDGPEALQSGSRDLRDWEKRRSQIEWNIENAVSSLIVSLILFTEIIRKNNADFVEQAQIDSQDSSDNENSEKIEDGSDLDDWPYQRIKMMSPIGTARRGVVDLRDFLRAITERLQDFLQILRQPRSGSELLQTTFGEVVPLTFERFRICELLAELLHCSNMSLSNRFAGEEAPSKQSPVMWSKPRADISEQTSSFTSADSSPSASFPPSKRGSLSDGVSGGTLMNRRVPDSDFESSTEDTPFDESDADSMDSESGILTAKQARKLQRLINHNPVPTHAELGAVIDLENAMGDREAIRHMERLGLKESEASEAVNLARRNPRHPMRRTAGRRKVSYRETIGDGLKRRWIELSLSDILLELFFDYPWNNFLHSIVCDVIQQIYQSGVDPAPLPATGRRHWTRELVEDLLSVRKVTTRLVFGWRANEGSVLNARQRLGYMGHLTQMADYTHKFLTQNPAIANELEDSFDKTAWQEYVEGPLAAVKAVEDGALGGTPPSTVEPASVADGGSFAPLGSLSIVEQDSDDEDETTLKPSRSYLDEEETSSLGMFEPDEFGRDQFDDYMIKSIGKNSFEDTSSDDEPSHWRRTGYQLERFSDDSGDEEETHKAPRRAFNIPDLGPVQPDDEDDFGDFVEAGEFTFPAAEASKAPQTTLTSRHTRTKSAPLSKTLSSSRKRSNSQTQVIVPDIAAQSVPSPSHVPAGRDVVSDSPPLKTTSSKSRSPQGFATLRPGRRTRSNSNAERRMHIEIDGKTIEVPRDDFSLYQEAEQQEAVTKASPTTSIKSLDDNSSSASANHKGHKRTNSRTIVPSVTSAPTGPVRINARSTSISSPPSTPLRGRRSSLPNLEYDDQSRTSSQDVGRSDWSFGSHSSSSLSSSSVGPNSSGPKRGHAKRHSISSSSSNGTVSSLPSSPRRSSTSRKTSSRGQVDLAFPTRSSSISEDRK